MFFCLAPLTVAGWIPYALTGWRIQPPLLDIFVGRPIGIALVAAGAACLVESFARFAIRGRGTPAPIAPTEVLVVSGLYRYVRNPMYLAVLAIIAGQALLLGSLVLLAYAAFIWLLFHAFVLSYEEPTLGRKYGASYDAYREHVRRWMPRLTPWRLRQDPNFPPSPKSPGPQS